MRYECSMDQQRMIAFLRNMIRTSRQKIFLILDNLKVHHGNMVGEWVSRHQDKIELFFLPPYAPESNPDEYLNHGLKLSVHTGDLPKNIPDIRHKTNSYMRTLQRNKIYCLRFLPPPSRFLCLCSGIILSRKKVEKKESCGKIGGAWNILI